MELPGGTAKTSVSLARKSGSGAVRWKVTDEVESSVTIPADRSQRRPSLRQAVPPTMVV